MYVHINIYMYAHIYLCAYIRTYYVNVYTYQYIDIHPQSHVRDQPARLHSWIAKTLHYKTHQCIQIRKLPPTEPCLLSRSASAPTNLPSSAVVRVWRCIRVSTLNMWCARWAFQMSVVEKRFCTHELKHVVCTLNMWCARWAFQIEVVCSTGILICAVTLTYAVKTCEHLKPI